MNNRKPPRTSVVTERFARPANEQEDAAAQTAIVGALVGVHGTEEYHGGDAGLIGLWHRHGEFWSWSTTGYLQDGVVTVPAPAPGKVAHLYDLSGPAPSLTLLYLQDNSRVLDLSLFRGKKILLELSHVRNVKEN